MGMNPRIALAIRSTDDYEYDCRAAMLELTDDVIYRLNKCNELIQRMHDKEDKTLREMRFGGVKNIVLYGVDMLNWIDCMGAWGRRWQNELASERITLMPMNCLTMPCVEVWESFCELVATYRPDQDPRFGWRFFVLEHPVEIYTTPLPLATYKKFYDLQMESPDMERLYEPG